MEDLLPGVSSHTVTTPRLTMHYLESGPADGVPVVMLHGNLATSRFFEHIMSGAPERYRFIAPDMRGFGDTEKVWIDAARGLRDSGGPLRPRHQPPARQGTRRVPQLRSCEATPKELEEFPSSGVAKQLPRNSKSSPAQELRSNSQGTRRVPQLRSCEATPKELEEFPSSGVAKQLPRNSKSSHPLSL